MPIEFNFKVCDNAAECNGIGACPVKAITWNQEKQSLEVDNSKCTACGSCALSCPVEGAILVAKDNEEYERILKQIQEDPRTVKELLKERYGAAIGSGRNMLKASDFNQVENSQGLVFVELFKPEYISCRAHSIKYEELAPGKEFKVWKIDCNENNSTAEKLGIDLFPSIAIFKDGKELGRFSGKVTAEKQKEFRTWFFRTIS